MRMSNVRCYALTVLFTNYDIILKNDTALLRGNEVTISVRESLIDERNSRDIINALLPLFLNDLANINNYNTATIVEGSELELPDDYPLNLINIDFDDSDGKCYRIANYIII